MKKSLGKAGLFVVLVAGLVVRVGRAQAPIDPSLPEAPISHHRGLFLFSGYGMVYDPNSAVPPLRTRQKFELAFRRTVNVSTVIRAGFVSGFDEAASVGPDYGDGASAFGELYGYNVASLASNAFFTDAFLPTLFRQDPRYFRKGSGTVKSRIGWALRSELVAYSDTGHEMPNYSEVLGFGLSTALSDAYLPAQNVSFWKTMEGWGIKVGVDSGIRVYREFGAKVILKKLRGK
ncbi:MAG TPA: hypothetical protein VMU48_16195 [Terracidiphilus sp.]|nr:hypothetical protein [Terracidiphilus sp.]